MRGAVGPLLCIGNLLSDVGEADDGGFPMEVNLDKGEQTAVERCQKSTAEYLNRGTTLMDCSQTEVMRFGDFQSTNSNVGLLSEKIQELEQIVKRGVNAVAAAKAPTALTIRKKDLPVKFADSP